MVTAKQDSALKHVEFVSVGARQGAGHHGERRRPGGKPRHRHPARAAGLGLIGGDPTISTRGWRGRTIDTARAEILAELESDRAMLDALTAKVVAEGLATLAGPGGERQVLIVRGTSHLLDSVEAQADIERIRTLFDDIERKADLIRLLELAKDGDGVRIFIGSENRLFSLVGLLHRSRALRQCGQGKIVGVIGVLGPTRLNYGRIIPMVDHTAKVIGRLLA
jgi:heat-inducible transcriptional repressor